MKPVKCPWCKSKLRVVAWDDGTHAGECQGCFGIYWPLVIGVDNEFHVAADKWDEPVVSSTVTTTMMPDKLIIIKDSKRYVLRRGGYNFKATLAGHKAAVDAVEAMEIRRVCDVADQCF